MNLSSQTLVPGERFDEALELAGSDEAFVSAVVRQALSSSGFYSVPAYWTTAHEHWDAQRLVESARQQVVPDTTEELRKADGTSSTPVQIPALRKSIIETVGNLLASNPPIPRTRQKGNRPKDTDFDDGSHMWTLAALEQRIAAIRSGQDPTVASTMFLTASVEASQREDSLNSLLNSAKAAEEEGILSFEDLISNPNEAFARVRILEAESASRLRISLLGSKIALPLAGQEFTLEGLTSPSSINVDPENWLHILSAYEEFMVMFEGTSMVWLTAELSIGFANDIRHRGPQAVREMRRFLDELREAGFTLSDELGVGPFDRMMAQGVITLLANRLPTEAQMWRTPFHRTQTLSIDDQRLWHPLVKEATMSSSEH